MAFAQVGDYEGRSVAAVEVVLEGSPPDSSAQAEFQSLIKINSSVGYSAVLARQSLRDLFASDRVANARVEITGTHPGSAGGALHVRFVIQRQIVIAGVTVRVGETTGTPVATDEIRARLNLLEPGRRFSLQAVERNADEIQAYLRDRGYFNATVEHAEVQDPTDATGTRRRVIYTITPGEPARVAAFNIKLEPTFDDQSVRSSLKLQPGALFTRDVLGDDVTRIRQAILARGFLSPTLEDPKVERNPDTNQIDITLTGRLGPQVNIAFKNYTLSEKKQRQLLPLKREGNLDFSVIEEGARRVHDNSPPAGGICGSATIRAFPGNAPGPAGVSDAERIRC